MEKKVIGIFTAIRFDGLAYYFVVYDDKTMDCPMLGAHLVRKVELKPRFEMYSGPKVYINPAPTGGSISGLIKEYVIDADLFCYLRTNKMIRYSTDMAYLYNFPDKNGYDQTPQFKTILLCITNSKSECKNHRNAQRKRIAIEVPKKVKYIRHRQENA